VFIHIGTGENKQFLPYGLERTEPRNARLEEFIRTVKILMVSQDPVTLPDNRFWPMEDALVALPPFRVGRTVPIIMVGGGPRAMRIAARVADGIGTYIPGAFGDSVERYEEDLAVFWAEVERVGRDPKTLRARAFDQVILCENDAQVDEAVRSPFTRSLVLNLTPTGKTWREAWGVEHPLGDDWALSVTHRSTMFTRDELLRIIEPVTPDIVQRMILVATPEEAAARAVPWLRAAGTTHVPLTHGSNFSTTLFPDQLLPADDGLPRWHHLALRYTAELNRLLAAG
jgi:phthiodiolone/phenolphthiodiolone dimycocerosates ketoreductase